MDLHITINTAIDDDGADYTCHTKHQRDVGDVASDYVSCGKLGITCECCVYGYDDLGKRGPNRQHGHSDQEL